MSTEIGKEESEEINIAGTNKRKIFKICLSVGLSVGLSDCSLGWTDLHSNKPLDSNI